jgi:hypothetical protein
MRALAWQAFLLLVAGWISWWLFLRVPPAPASPIAREPAAVLTVLPVVRESLPSAALATTAAAPQTGITPEAVPLPVPPPEPTPSAAADLELADSPPPPLPSTRELGTPEGDADDPGLPAEPEEPEVALEDPETQPAQSEELPEPSAAQPAETTAQATDADSPVVPAPLDLPDATPPAPDAPAARPSAAPPKSQPQHPPAEEPASPRPARVAVEALMNDPALVAAARAEFSAGNQRGFTTVLLAAPEEQIEIARFFGEELVLVPRAAIDPANPQPAYFRLAGRGAPVVERVASAPRLEQHRQYRDLFDYEYARLPVPLRELRRSLVARGEVYLFAALLSAEEWALVIARRGEALERAGRELAEVRRFVLRYARLPGGGFDLRAEEVVFADGSRFVPGLAGKGDG